MCNGSATKHVPPVRLERKVLHMSYTTVQIEVKEKGTSVVKAKGEKVVFGLDAGQTVPEALQALVDEGLQTRAGTVTWERLLNAVNYAWDLWTRRKLTPTATCPDKVASVIAAVWAKHSPNTFSEAVGAQSLQAGINTYFRALSEKASSEDTKVTPDYVFENLPSMF